MKTTRAIQRTLSAGAALCLTAAALSGCELLVDFDRSKIPVADAGVGNDATVTDSSVATEAGDDSTVSGEVGPEAAGDDVANSDAALGNDDGSGDAVGAAVVDAGPVGAADALDDAGDAPTTDAMDGDDGG